MFPAQDIAHRHHEQHPINSALDQTIFIRYIRGKPRWKHLSRRREVVDQDIEADHLADTGLARDESVPDDTADSDDSNNYMAADESAAGPADALDIGSFEHEDFTDYLEPVLEYLLKVVIFECRSSYCTTR
ncbi:hypothetical protein PENSPDRAFT_500652 [Peniophora sp. CONT]|nr:hypothetical protein PENSPDRAFT_500652 [Peniophora sp. CONT]